MNEGLKRKRARLLQQVVSVRVLIIVTTVGLVVLASAIAYLTQHFLLASGINDLAQSIRDSVLIGTEYQIRSVFDAAIAVTKIDNATMSYNIANLTLQERLPYFQHLYSLLQSSTAISTISYATAIGDSISSSRNTTNRLTTTNATSDFAYYSAFAGTNLLYMYNVDLPNLTIGSLQTVVFFNVTSRPWWSIGLNSPDGSYVWSGIYPGLRNSSFVSTSQPFFVDDTNEIAGLFVVQLSLPRLKDSLSNLTAYSATTVILVTETGDIILDSCPSVGSGIPVTCPGLVGDPIRTIPLAQSGGIYAEIDDYVIKTYGNWSNIPNNASVTIQDQWITFSAIVDRNLLWYALIIIDSNAYLNKVDKATTFTIIAICVFGVVAALLAGVIGVVVTRPFTRAIAHMDQIATMDFTKEINHKKSGLYEINAMERALSKLYTAMCSFEKFVPNRVVKEILSQDIVAHLGVTPWYATVFFCDIEDFTTISELMAPEDLVSLLLDFLQEMSNIILEETRGTIDKFIGDAIMAFWNAPHPVENHAEMACFAALRCRQKVITDLRPKWESKGLPEGIVFNARFGIHTGDMLIGNIGSLERINYTAIGDSVNIASRLESLCKFYQVSILISEATYSLVKELFLCRPLDLVIVKGKTQAFILYELVCELEDATEEEIAMCTLHQNAAYYLFIEPEPEKAIEAYTELLRLYPHDISIQRVSERLGKLNGSELWPGMESFDHK